MKKEEAFLCFRFLSSLLLLLRWRIRWPREGGRRTSANSGPPPDFPWRATSQQSCCSERPVAGARTNSKLKSKLPSKEMSQPSFARTTTPPYSLISLRFPVTLQRARRDQKVEERKITTQLQKSHTEKRLLSALGWP